MSGLRSLFGGGNSSTIPPDYTGLQIQTAVNTLPIPIVWGASKVAPNVIWYNNFQTQTSGGGKGSGGKGGLFASSNNGSVTYTYSAAIILALAEGPIAGIGQVWKNQSVYSLADLTLTLFGGTTPQSPWSYVSSAYPAQALGYQGTAYVCNPDYSLGTSATLDNHNFEVLGLQYGTGTNGIDADPSLCINDFLTNAQFGVGFPSASIDATTLFGSGGDASYQTYCKAYGLNLSPALSDQEQASSILERWLQLTNTAAVWSGGLLKFIPYGDASTTAGTNVTVTSLQEIGQVPSGSSNPPPIVVANSSYFVSDGGVTYSPTGAALTYIGASYPSNAGEYGMSPAGTYLFAAGDSGSDINITYTSAVAASYVPNVTPIYDLGDDDYLVENNQDPLQVSRTDPFEAYNVWRLEIAERNNAYNLTCVESRDQNMIELVEQATGSDGMRIAPTVTAHEICDPDVALISGQLMLQRAVYIRNTCKFRLSWEYCLLDPMDLVTVTDSVLGLSEAPVRITEIEEDENGFLSVTAEEFPLGVATATLYATQPVTSNPINRNVAADPVNAPVVFEPPSSLVSIPQVWIAASGGSGGVADANWGGCNVYLSTDGSSYSQIGQIVGPAPQGVLTASLPSFSGTNPDSTDTLAVNMADSAQALTGGTLQDAMLGNTLCIVGSELLSFETAALASANNYNLTTLFRGLYGTTATIHSTGSPFARLDNAIFKYDLPPQYVGVTLYIKLQSFNVFGGGVQDISTCTAYTYTPTGAAYDHPVAETMLVGGNLDLGSVTTSPAAEDDFGTPLTLAVELDVDLGVA